MALEMRVLGSAAGGGFPQWNCGCTNCARARLGVLAPRTQDSVAVSANRQDWFLVNASPDVGRQIEANRPLWPRAQRSSPIRGVALTSGDLDHALGLLLLREGQPLAVYATPEVRAGLEQNSMLRTLKRFDGQLVWRTLTLGREQELIGPDDERSGVMVRAFAAPGKPPLHLAATTKPSAGDNIGLTMWAGESGKAVYLSSTSAITPVLGELEGAATLLLDGTFWSETELIDAKLGSASAKDMAHLPVGGPTGSVAQLAGATFGRKLLTHINNTNPILAPDSAERAWLRAQGWDLAEDGQRLVL